MRYIGFWCQLMYVRTKKSEIEREKNRRIIIMGEIPDFLHRFFPFEWFDFVYFIMFKIVFCCWCQIIIWYYWISLKGNRKKTFTFFYHLKYGFLCCIFIWHFFYLGFFAVEFLSNKKLLLSTFCVEIVWNFVYDEKAVRIGISFWGCKHLLFV